MQGLTRGAMTLFGVVVAGFLIWWGASALPGEGDATIGEFWWAAGLIAAAGLIMALSQLLGGVAPLLGQRLPARLPAGAYRRRLDGRRR